MTIKIFKTKNIMKNSTLLLLKNKQAKRKMFALKTVFIVLLFFASFGNSVKAQCTPAFTFDACTMGNDFWITSVTLNDLSGAEGNCANAGTVRPETGSVVAGSTYTITVNRNGNGFQAVMQVWADWNNDNAFNNTDEYILDIFPINIL